MKPHYCSVFQVNRSSLLVPEQVPKPQEVNGTNGRPALPAIEPAEEPVKRAEPSTDSEEEDGGDVGDLGNSKARQNRALQTVVFRWNPAYPRCVCVSPLESGNRDRTVLHCQFCGKRGHAHNFMRSKRFCSTSCARG